MFIVIKYVILATLASAAAAYGLGGSLQSRQTGSTWNLIFNDDFTGNALDTTKWEYQTGCDESKLNFYLQLFGASE